MSKTQIQALGDPLESFNMFFEKTPGDRKISAHLKPMKPKKVLTNLNPLRKLKPVTKLRKDDIVANTKKQTDYLQLASLGLLTVAAILGISALLGNHLIDFIMATLLAILLFIESAKKL